MRERKRKKPERLKIPKRKLTSSPTDRKNLKRATEEKTRRTPIRTSPGTRARTRTETLIRTRIPTAADSPRALTRSPE